MSWSKKYKKTIDCNNPKGFSQKAHCWGKKKKMNEEKKDHEYSMARSELKTIKNAVKRLNKKIGKKSEGDLKAWVQSKITKSADYIDTAADYVTNEEIDGKSAKDKDYSLRDWFKGGGWVQTGGKYDGKPCAKQPGQKTKPFCRDPDDRIAMSKDERERRAKKKRKEDPNPERKGKAKMVKDSYSNWREELGEGYMDIQVGNQRVIKRYGNTQNNTSSQVRPTPRPTSTPRPKPTQKPLSPSTIKTQSPPPSSSSIMSQPKNVRATGALKKVFKGVPFLGKVADVVDKYNRKANYADQPASVRKKLGLENYNEFASDKLNEKKDACYKKVKSRYKVWPSAYASGALVKCRKVGASNWGSKDKKESYNFSNWRDDFKAVDIETVDLIKSDPIGSVNEKKDPCWSGYKKVGMKSKNQKIVPNCIKENLSDWRSELEESKIDKDKMKCNKPKAQAVGDSKTGKSHVVKACEGGKEKIIRFGQRGVKGSPKKEGESKAYANRRKRFKSRHAKNIAKGKMSAAYWSDRVKW